MKEQLLQIKQDIIDISNDLKTNLANKGVTADGTLSELVDSVQNIDSNVLAEIGWNLVEQPFLKDAIDYAKEIYKNPKNTYSNDKQLIIFPKVDELELKQQMFTNSGLTLFPEGIKLTGNLYGAFASSPVQYLDLTKLQQVDRLDTAFNQCKNLQVIITNENFGVNSVSMGNLFNNCVSLKSPITLNISSCTNISNAFNECNLIPSITLVGDPSQITNTSAMCNGCDSLTSLTVPENFPVTTYSLLGGIKVPKINGSFDFTLYNGYGSNYYFWVFYFDTNIHTRYMLCKNLGYRKDGSYLNMEYSRVWGIANDEVPDARQSLIDSLITYSYDRAAAGYSTQTWKLYKDVKALLTEDEIAQITAKGYTLI